jgi:hypothetical protein
MAGCILGGGTAVNAGLWWNVSAQFLWSGDLSLTL